MDIFIFLTVKVILQKDMQRAVCVFFFWYLGSKGMCLSYAHVSIAARCVFICWGVVLV